MSKRFFDDRKDLMIRAGDIRRHPHHQRPSPLRTFEKRFGAFDLGKCTELIHVIPGPNGEGYWAINGATRVEACCKSKKYGPDTKLLCRLYGNGVPPKPEELDELFLLLNADVVAVRWSMQFERSVGAKRRNAVVADRLAKKLGKNFQSPTTLWKLVERYGEEITEKGVDFVIDVWGTEEYMPAQIVKGVVTITRDKDNAKRLRSRRTTLSHYKPDYWRLKAQAKMLQTIGKRDTVNNWVIKLLLGRRS